MPTRVFFTARDEMVEFLTARNWKSIPSDGWDDAGHAEWMLTTRDQRYLLKVAEMIFDDTGKLKIFTTGEWDESWISRSEYEPDFGDPFADQ